MLKKFAVLFLFQFVGLGGFFLSMVHVTFDFQDPWTQGC